MRLGQQPPLGCALAQGCARSAGRGGAVGLLLALGVCAAAPDTNAEGFHFEHKDWELACDNTGTCRAAGYHADEADLQVSVLLTRSAGPGTTATASVMLGDYQQHPEVTKLPASATLTMWIHGRSLGPVRLEGGSLTGHLSPAQTQALIAALPRASSQIAWRHGRTEWVLSDRGAKAVLLKMDEAQGRLGTVGAWVARGERDERQVPGPRQAPRVTAAALPPTTDADRIWPQRQGPALLAALRANVKATEANCDRLLDQTPDEWSVTRLTAHRLLVSTPCWLAAYNFGSGAWVVQDRPPYQATLVTDSASDASDGEITASHKGRGLGDCWSSESWVWDGQRFVRTGAHSTGQCKLITAGGAWQLPTWVTR